MKLPSIIGDHMVLQRDVPAPIWGWAEPGQTVKVTFKGKTLKATAGADGKWLVRLPKQKAGGPHKIVIVAGKEKRTLSNVLFGEVWLCSGQSNMDWTLGASDNARSEATSAQMPEVRLCKVLRIANRKPQDDCSCKWEVCDHQTAWDKTAVGFFFARHLHCHLGVPVGIIDSALGGSPVEAWMNEQAVKDAATSTPTMAEFQKAEESLAELRAKDPARLREVGGMVVYADKGNEGDKAGWHRDSTGVEGWKTIKAPGTWQGQGIGNFNGAVWYRKTVEVPAEWAGKDLALNLGAVDDFDVTYFNGERVGTTGEETPSWWTAPREYTVPGNLVRAGSNTITVRVFDHFGNGGLVGPTERINLMRLGQERTVSLTGDWQVKVELALPPLGFLMGFGFPTGLYNAMLHPLAPFAIRGALWYQGESNAGRHFEYASLLSAMITGWRKAFQCGDFPFFIVQLPNFNSEGPAGTTWPMLRQAQALVAEKLPNTYITVNTDLGNPKDIHPTNKQPVSDRLALLARKVVYGEKDLPAQSPKASKVTRKGNDVYITFRDAEVGLVTPGNSPVKGFLLAAGDGAFQPAKAVIEGKTVRVSSERMAGATTVAYAWANNPEGANLFTRAGLPVMPFCAEVK